MPKPVSESDEEDFDSSDEQNFESGDDDYSETEDEDLGDGRQVHIRQDGAELVELYSLADHQCEECLELDPYQDPCWSEVEPIVLGDTLIWPEGTCIPCLRERRACTNTIDIFKKDEDGQYKYDEEHREQREKQEKERLQTERIKAKSAKAKAIQEEIYRDPYEVLLERQQAWLDSWSTPIDQPRIKRLKIESPLQASGSSLNSKVPDDVNNASTQPAKNAKKRAATSRIRAAEQGAPPESIDSNTSKRTETKALSRQNKTKLHKQKQKKDAKAIGHNAPTVSVQTRPLPRTLAEALESMPFPAAAEFDFVTPFASEEHSLSLKAREAGPNKLEALDIFDQIEAL